jgi:anti-sigma regulatory factor (Ser/Thr protein kinase)
MPAASPSLTLDLPPEPTSARVARDALRRLCPDHPRLDEALLCLSEIVTNAVLHARTSSIARIFANGDDLTLRIEVRDRSRIRPVHKNYGLTAPTGRGLHLLDHISDRWGVEGDADGKLIWVELDGEPDG